MVVNVCPNNTLSFPLPLLEPTRSSKKGETGITPQGIVLNVTHTEYIRRVINTRAWDYEINMIKVRREGVEVGPKRVKRAWP